YTFSPIDYQRYPLLKLILTAARRRDNSLILLNACDEVAIDYFLRKKIRYFDMHKAMSFIVNKYPSIRIKNIEDVIYWDNWAREKTKEYFNRLWAQ
ncbi:MAG: hypothetical protein JW867_00555, partial [Candidatus Omnitrophica bacterium]|nr:hypothetical protein [Candidatus Omnitrophota bacterium]